MNFNMRMAVADYRRKDVLENPEKYKYKLTYGYCGCKVFKTKDEMMQFVHDKNIKTVCYKLIYDTTYIVEYEE